MADSARPLAWSAGLHAALWFVILYAAFFAGFRGQGWGAGGGGNAMSATLVSSVPLPANPQQTQNVLANESKGLSQSVPKPEEKEPDAIPIPDKNAKLKKKPGTAASRASLSPKHPRDRIRFLLARAGR